MKSLAIEREFGSGGREVGRIVADLLGVRCYDREIIEATAAKTKTQSANVLLQNRLKAASAFMFLSPVVIATLLFLFVSSRGELLYFRPRG